MSKIKVFLVDDHRLLTDTWKQLLEKHLEISVVGVASNGISALAEIQVCCPDIVLVDIAMEPIDGFKLTAQVTSLKPAPGVIGVTLYSMPPYMKKLFYAGALGYVTKNSGADELIEAILTVYKGERYICKQLREVIANTRLFENDKPDRDKALFELTRREWTIIQHVKSGLTSKEIGQKEFISTKTVEVHRYNILKKLNLPNVAALINFMTLRGL